MPDESTGLMAFVATLREALGPKAGATADDVLTAIREVTGHPQSHRDTRAEMMESLASATYEMWSETRERAHEARVSDAIASAKLPYALRKWGLAMCRENPALFDDFVRTTPGFTHLLGRDPALQKMMAEQAKAPDRSRGGNSIMAQLGLIGD